MFQSAVTVSILRWQAYEKGVCRRLSSRENILFKSFFRPSLHYYFRNISISRLPHKWYQITIENNSNKTFQKPNEKKNQSKPNGRWTIFRSCENDSIKEYSHHILMDSFLSVLIKITSYTNHRVKCIFQTAPTKNVPETRTNFNVRSSPRYEEMRKNKTTKNIGIKTKHKYQAMKRIIAWNRQPKLCTFLLRNTFSFFRMLILLFIFDAPDPFFTHKIFYNRFFFGITRKQNSKHQTILMEKKLYNALLNLLKKSVQYSTKMLRVQSKKER